MSADGRLIELTPPLAVTDSLPNLKTVEADCRNLARTCEPQQHQKIQNLFWLLECLCILGFTLDYFIRLVTVTFVRPHVYKHANSGTSSAVFHYSVDV